MRNKILCLFIVLCNVCLPLFSKDKEVSVEEQYFLDLQKEQNKEVPINVAFAQQLQLALEKGNVEAAIKLFDSIPKELENNIDFKIILASLYISNGQYDKATQTAKKVLEIDSSNLEALEIITFASRASGDKTSFSKMNNQILQKDPNNVTANIMKAEEYTLTKNYFEAKQCYQKALKTEPKNTDALYGLAMTSYFLRDDDMALDACNTVLEIDPENVASLAFKGKLYAEKNNYKLACEYVEKALSLGGNNYTYMLDLGMYYTKRNMNKKAIELWEKAVKIQPDYFLGYAYLGGLYNEMGNKEKSLQNYHQVVRTNPKYYFAYEEIAILEFYNQNWDNSIKYFTKAYEFSKSWSYQMLIAASQLHKKDLVNAKKTLASLMKGLDRESVEYLMARFFNDSYSKNAENVLTQKISKEDNRNTKGKMLFYMGLYYDINGFEEVAKEYYTKVTNMQAPLFFEYRLAEWGLKI